MKYSAKFINKSSYLLTLCRRLFKHKMAKKLAVFDFDHTIADDNSDIVIRRLLKAENIPETTKKLYKSSGWTVYMQEIFKLLHKYRTGESCIKRAISKIPAVDSVKELIIEMVDKLNFDVIIISDSNSIFINEWLIANHLDSYVHTVFTNPAKYNAKGLLEISMYHVQKECKLSTVNLCKGKIMQDFVKQQKELGIVYSQIVYVGDGRNDFCPILRLGEGDIGCVRDGYACVDLVKNALDKKSEHSIKARICIWKTGKDILQYIKK